MELEVTVDVLLIWWTSELDVECTGGCTAALRRSRGWKPPVEPAMTAASADLGAVCCLIWPGLGLLEAGEEGMGLRDRWERCLPPARPIPLPFPFWGQPSCCCGGGGPCWPLNRARLLSRCRLRFSAFRCCLVSSEPALPLVWAASLAAIAAVAAVAAGRWTGARWGLSAVGLAPLRGASAGSSDSLKLLLLLLPRGDELRCMGLVFGGDAAAAGDALAGEGGGRPASETAGVGAVNGVPALG